MLPDKTGETTTFAYVVNPDGTTGEPADATGLVYLRARYLDPELGRFMTRDPFAGRTGSPVSLQRFGYANSNPVTLADPNGRCPIVMAAIAGAAAGSVVPGPGTATGAAGGIVVGFGLCLLELAVEALAVNEAAGDPLEIRRDPLPQPRPVPDPRLDRGFPLDTLFGPVNPFTGDRQPSFRCETMRCKLIFAGLAAIAGTVFAVFNVQAAAGQSSVAPILAPKSRVLEPGAGGARHR